MDETPAVDILVIEDDADACANLRDILELDGHRVVTAAGAAEALDRDDWDRFASIILDRRLPDATAEQLLPKLKAWAPAAAVIVVTGYADIQGAIAALRQGATDYILKPLNPDLLRASLARVAERQRLALALKQAQQRAMQAERLAAIGQVVAGLAHESRNALQRSQARLEMLALTVRDRPEALDLIARLQKAQDHLHLLYEDVRAYAAPIVLDRRPCDLTAVWREAWAHLEAAGKEKDAILRETAPGVNVHYVADAFRLGQVFHNLFDNALAAGRPPVEVEIHAEAADLEGQPAVRLFVCDNGPGLDPQQRQKVFDPFFTTKTKGTGLGMAIAKRIVEAHGGQIAVGDGAGEAPGAVFIVTLPRGTP
jgi:signal transduction histidine kinase